MGRHHSSHRVNLPLSKVLPCWNLASDGLRARAILQRLDMKSRFDNDELVLDSVALKRVARNLRAAVADPGFRVPDSPEAWQELAAQALGKCSYFELRQQAKIVPAGLPEYGSVNRHSFGYPFNHRLPRAFDAVWQARAMELARAALRAVRGEPAHVVCVVGKSGSGKTVLLNHLAHAEKGVVFDVAFLHSPYVRQLMGADAIDLRIFDGGETHIRARAKFDAEVLKSSGMRPLSSVIVQEQRSPWDTLFQAYAYSMGERGPWDKSAKSRVNVVSLPSRDDALRLCNSIMHPGYGEQKARPVIERVQLLDLECMQLTVLAPSGFPP